MGLIRVTESTWSVSLEHLRTGCLSAWALFLIAPFIQHYVICLFGFGLVLLGFTPHDSMHPEHSITHPTTDMLTDSND